MWKCRLSAPALTIGRSGATMVKCWLVLDTIISYSEPNGNACFDRLTTGGPARLQRETGRLLFDKGGWSVVYLGLQAALLRHGEKT